MTRTKPNPDAELWDIRKVAEKTTLGIRTIWRKVAEGLFPPPRQVTESRRAWLSSDVLKWMDDRPAA